MKILCLFVRHGTTKYPNALDVLDRWYARHELLHERTLWIIDNALAADDEPVEVAPQATLRPGDNRAWEFSAWARALREAREERVHYDVAHFVTSAFNTMYTGYLEHFHRDMLDYVVTRNVCLGHFDSFSKTFQLGGGESRTWVRTCFFFLPRYVTQALSPWPLFRDPAEFFVSPDSRTFRPDAPLSPEFQSHIAAWLEGREIGGYTWHSPVDTGPDGIRQFQQKTLAILNEHRLTVTVRLSGIPIVDFCWLHSTEKISLANQPDPVGEAEQLRARRRILGIPDEKPPTIPLPP